VNSPASVTSTLGVQATASDAGGSFLLVQQGSTWGGNFSNGDNLLWTYFGGPMTISFATPISAVAMNVQADFYGAYAGDITAYDSSEDNLGTFDFSGVSNDDRDGSAAFIGIQDLTAPDISFITIELTSASYYPADFAINQVSLSSAASAVPLPSSLYGGLALVLSLAGGLAYRRRSFAQTI